MSALFPDRKYSIIYADPPWGYRESIHREKKGPQTFTHVTEHYPTMTPSEIDALPVTRIAEDDCLLFLWATGPILDQAIDTGRSWGFQYKTIAFVWDKRLTTPGNYTLPSCEICLVFKRGRIPKPRGARNIRQLISEERTRHSRKPPSIRERITFMFPTQSKIELFARERARGWDAWGNEL